MAKWGSLHHETTDRREQEAVALGPERMQQPEKPTPATAHVFQKRKQEASEEKELEDRLCMTLSPSVPARSTRRDRKGLTIRRLHILHPVNLVCGFLIRMYPIPHHRRN